MFTILFGYEIFIETIPVAGNLLEWYLSDDENHIWFRRIHIVFNKI
jgi:hypothetical protein